MDIVFTKGIESTKPSTKSQTSSVSESVSINDIVSKFELIAESLGCNLDLIPAPKPGIPQKSSEDNIWIFDSQSKYGFRFIRTQDLAPSKNIYLCLFFYVDDKEPEYYEKSKNFNQGPVSIVLCELVQVPRIKVISNRDVKTCLTFKDAFDEIKSCLISSVKEVIDRSPRTTKPKLVPNKIDSTDKSFSTKLKDELSKYAKAISYLKIEAESYGAGLITDFGSKSGDYNIYAIPGRFIGKGNESIQISIRSNSIKLPKALQKDKEFKLSQCFALITISKKIQSKMLRRAYGISFTDKMDSFKLSDLTSMKKSKNLRVTDILDDYGTELIAWTKSIRCPDQLANIKDKAD